MLVRFVWPDFCDDAGTTDAFWVECTEEEARDLLGGGELLPAPADRAWADVPYGFLVARDQHFVLPRPGHFPYSNLWNGYSPFRVLPAPIHIHSLAELETIQVSNSLRDAKLGVETKSGVFVYDDFRDNLIIDRYDPVFTSMRGKKKTHLRSENSEDAITWNVFRSLRQIDPAVWLPHLAATAFGDSAAEWSPAEVSSATIKLWQTAPPPSSLLRFQQDEGESEVDVVIETDRAVWFIEAKYKSDISLSTTNGPDRDQILRNLDVGSYYAGTRAFYFALLIWDEERTREGMARLEEYRGSRESIIRRLPHREDALKNLYGIGLLRWHDLADVFEICTSNARQDEQLFATRARDWLARVNVAPVGQPIGGVR